jgi:hypothetical protein
MKLGDAAPERMAPSLTGDQLRDMPSEKLPMVQGLAIGQVWYEIATRRLIY